VPKSARWYAIAVKHQHERRIEAALRFKKMETLVPLYRSQSRWSDRTKEIDLPLFSGYVLCRLDMSEDMRERKEVLTTPGVYRLVGFGGTPVAVDDREIAAIQALSEAGRGLRPWPYLRPGDRVRVERGPLRGIEGTLLREGESLRLIVTVDLLQRAMAVEFDAGMLAPAALYKVPAALGKAAVA
jgi:transcription antitermination factor NusG